MNKVLIPALIATAAFSANAFADHRWHDDDCDHHHHRHGQRMEYVVVQPAYVEPRVVYPVPPQVIYRDRVVYREAPVYYEAPPRYPAPPSPYYGQPQPSPAYSGNRAMGQAIGAVAGGVIGNQFGRGNGRVVATAAGAVIGSVVGGNVASYGY